LKKALEIIADIPEKSCKKEAETCEVKKPSCGSTCSSEEKPKKSSGKGDKAAVKAVEKMEEKAEKKEALKETKAAVS
jgi:hypothetical protein